MATRMQQRRGTAAEWTSADPILGSGEIGYETDTNKFKIGDGTTAWSSLTYFTSIDQIVDGAPALLDTLNELAAAIGDDADFFTTINAKIDGKPSVIVGNSLPSSGPDGLEGLDYGDLWYDPSSGIMYVYYAVGDSNFWIESGGPNSLSDAVLGTNSHDFPESPSDGDTHKGYVYDLSRTAWQVDRSFTLDAASDLTITSPSDNDILQYNATAGEWVNQPGIPLDENLDIPLSYLTELSDDVDVRIAGFGTTTVQTEAEWAADSSVPALGSLNVSTGASIRAKIGDGSNTFANLEYIPNNSYVAAELATALSPYALKAGPTFSGTVSLPATTSIGDVSDAEIAHLDGVTSGIQGQLDSLDTLKADLASPTFTGTVSGIDKTMVGLSNVDNTSDVNKPVSTAQQTALDAKLDLAGGTLTGKLTLDGDPTQALHAVTKQYVDSVEAGLISRPAVKAATTANLSGTYTNGTAGVDAQLNLGQLATLDIDGITSWSQYDGILVKDQTNKAENGRYVVLQIGNGTDTDWVLKRCPLCDEADEIPGSYIFVTDGVTNEQTGWVQHVADPSTFTVGTDDIDVYQFAGAGAVTAGTNVSVSGNQVSVIDAPVFAGTVDASAAGVAFSDGTQTKAGVPSLTSFTQVEDTVQTATITNATGDGSAVTFTTAADHGFSAGDSVVVADVDSTYFNGTYTIATVPSTTTFTVASGEQEAFVSGGTATVTTVGNYTLDTLDHQDNIVEMNSSVGATFTIPTDAALAWPVGASMDIFATGTGEITIAGDTGVTVNATPGLTLRTQWSSATILKRGADSWVVYGDLKA